MKRLLLLTLLVACRSAFPIPDEGERDETGDTGCPTCKQRRYVPRDASVYALTPDTRLPDAGQCRDNLCGDPMYGEQYCSCHEIGGRRCWATSGDCEIDAACCSDGSCHGMVEDRCTAATRSARSQP